MNLHIMLTSSTYTAHSPLLNSLSSLSAPLPCLGEEGEDGVCNLTATRWVKPSPLPMREVEQETEHSREAVANLAYLFYLQDGCPEGKDKEHWAQAELFLSNLAS